MIQKTYASRSPRQIPLRFALALLATLTMWFVCPPAQAAFPGANGKIAFVRCCTGGLHQIYTMNADGTGQTQVSNGAANDQNPSWSADGTKIAFTSGPAGVAQIWTMNADGSGRTNVSNNAFNDYDPSWSPDGTKLAFTRETGQIYTMNANGTSQTNISNNGSSDQDPAWSPDGTKIAFDSNRTGVASIFTMNADGTNQTERQDCGPGTSTPCKHPAWSPDGTKLAFDMFLPATPQNTGALCTMNADGSNPSCALPGGNAGAVPEIPSWSPNGTNIVFDWNQSGTNQIYYTNANSLSSNPTRLTNNTANDTAPDWQPFVHGYARPRGASPFRASLTPAYRQCTSPNTAHRGSITAPSCYAPTPASSFLTVGTPDFNGQAAQSIGSVLFNVKTVAPEDLMISVSITDVRCQGASGGCMSALSPYGGALQFNTTFRITDKSNGPFASGPSTNGTVTDLPVRFSVPCGSAGAGVGSTCSAMTSIDSVVGASAITAGQRAIWQLPGPVDLYDGGSTGVAGAGDATLFAEGGLFLP